MIHTVISDNYTPDQSIICSNRDYRVVITSACVNICKHTHKNIKELSGKEKSYLFS